MLTLFLRQADFIALARASLPGAVARRSSAAWRQTAAGAGALRQEPVVPHMLHEPAPGLTSRCRRLVSDQLLIRGGRISLRHKFPRL